MYIVEGNIGVGKSTFLELISKHIPQINVVTEPKNNWVNQIFGQSLLENFYKKPNRWAYTIETLAMICRSRDHISEQHKTNKTVVMERSIYSGHYCFALNGYHCGFFTPIEWSIYNKWAEFILTKKCLPPKGFIYLKATPQVCMERIRKRNRISEKKITLSYIKQIDHWHEKFLTKKEEVTANIKNIPVLTINCNQDFIKNEQNMQKMLVMLQNFIEKTTKTDTVKLTDTVTKEKTVEL
jgi:deoxyadenosine/deoxycytidine kinase